MPGGTLATPFENQDAKVATEPLGIVIADDNRDHAESLATVVTLWGHDAYVCLRPERVMEDCLEYWPDVVLLDIGFPLRSDGLRVANEIKSNSGSAKTFVFAISGFSDDETRFQATKAGFDHYFVKPVDLDNLAWLLNNLPIHQ